MKINCLSCGIEFEDNYTEANSLNQRIWCDDCIQKKWSEFKQK